MKQSLRLDDLIRLVVTGAPDATALQHLSDSVLLANHLGELADQVVGHFVDQARDGGASWAEIGSSLGVTKQAAQKRFVSRPLARSARRSGIVSVQRHSVRSVKFEGTFDYYTDEALRVIAQAQQQAELARHAHIGSEHIVLALIDESDGVATSLIAGMGVSAEAVRKAFRAILGPAQRKKAPYYPFAPEAIRALEFAKEEAKHLGNDRVGTEHILLGILRDQNSLGAITLAGLGITQKKIETMIAR